MTDEEKYTEAIDTFERLFEKAMQLSIITSGRSGVTWQQEYGSHIFTKIVLTALAILRLLPKSKYSKPFVVAEVWDISSVSVLSRSLIETYHIFYYLIVQPVNNEEREFRFFVWQFHAEVERLKMLQLIQSKDPAMDSIRSNIENLRSRVVSHAFLSRLDAKKQKRVTDGEIGILLDNARISESAGLEPDYFRARYKYLSNWIHTFPYSVTQIATFKAGDSESLNLLTVVSNYSSAYLGLAMRDFIDVFPDQKLSVNSEMLEVIQIGKDMLNLKT